MLSQDDLRLIGQKTELEMKLTRLRPYTGDYDATEKALQLLNDDIKRTNADLPVFDPSDGNDHKHSVGVLHMIKLQHDTLTFSFPDVHADAKCEISFQRTLRIPDDDEIWPLPPGLGCFPIQHVDDFAAALPAQWKERGGVCFPMYQSEAMWIAFVVSLPNLEQRPAYQQKERERQEQAETEFSVAAGKPHGGHAVDLMKRTSCTDKPDVFP